MSIAAKRLRPIRYMTDRYGVCSKTIDRRVEQGILPAPVYINHLRYWNEVELDEADRNFQRAAGNGEQVAVQ